MKLIDASASTRDAAFLLEDRGHPVGGWGHERDGRVSHAPILFRDASIRVMDLPHPADDSPAPPQSRIEKREPPPLPLQHPAHREERVPPRDPQEGGVFRPSPSER
jgi:hypothetical protein